MVAFLLPFLAAGLAGCGESLPPQPERPANATTVGPHDGVAFALPQGVGYAEFVNEPPPGDRDSAPTSVVVYFLGPDAKSSLNPSPSEVKIRIDSRSKRGQSMALKLMPKADDPAGSARFTSTPGPYRLDEVRGELIATLDGKPITVPFSPR